MITDLASASDWTWVTRNISGQTNLAVGNLPSDRAFFRLGPPTAIRPGFCQQVLVPNDDDCYNCDGYDGTVLSNLVAAIGFPINFFGKIESKLYVNNNGNVSFDALLPTYTPYSLADASYHSSLGVIAPFWADVDTRGTGSGVASYGTNSVGGRAAFGVTWDHVGYFREQDDKLNTFQLVLVDRSDRAGGDYDIEFNYSQVQWESGVASGGSDGIGGYPARAGFASNTNNAFEMPGSGISGSFLDKSIAGTAPNPTGLIYSNFNSTIPGRYVFQFHNGWPVSVPTNATPDSQVAAQARARSRGLLEPKNH